MRWTLVLLLIACATALAAGDEASWRRLMDEGRAAGLRGDYPSAGVAFESAVREAEAFGPDDPRLATSLLNLARAKARQGSVTDAEPLARRALAIREKVLDPEHPDVGEALGLVGGILGERKIYPEAEHLLRRSLAILDKTLTPQHLEAARSAHHLARVLLGRARPAEAEPLIRRALAVYEKQLGADHPDVALAEGGLANVLVALGRLAEAEPHARRSVEIRERALGAQHPEVVRLRTALERLARAIPHAGDEAAAAASAAAAREKGSYIVPFETRFNIILVKGSLNGQDGHIFWVDTGASVTFVTWEAATKAGWTARRGRIEYCPSIGAGDAVVKDIRVLIGDPPGARPLRDFGVDYSGILGHSFLERFVTTLDYKKQQLTLVPVGKARELEADGKESWLVPFRLAGKIIIVEGRINGQGPLTLVFGLGGSSTIITSETAKKLGIKGKRKFLQVGGEVEVATVASISVGEAVAENLTILIADPRAARELRMLGVDYNGLLGATFFHRFLVTIDYRANQIRLATSGTPPGANEQ